MKIIKKLIILIIFIGLLFVFNTSVEAAGISIKTSKSTVKPGENFKVTISVSNGAGYVSASVSNGSGGFGSTWLENSSKSFTCKAGSSGTITIKTSGTVADFTTEKDESASRSKSIKIQEKTTTKTTTKKSTNQKEEIAEEKKLEENKDENNSEENYSLKSLEIEGEKIFPEFNSDVFEYTLNIKDKEKLNINAKANKEDLIVEIIGNENLAFGENTILIRLKGQDDKEMVSYKINVIKEKSELTLANEKIQKLEKINKIFIVIISLFIIFNIIMVVIYSKERKNKLNDNN